MGSQFASVDGPLYRGLLQRLHGVLLFAFVALLIVMPWAYWLMPLLILLSLVAGSVARGVFGLSLGEEELRVSRDDLLWMSVLVAYGGLWLLDAWHGGQWPHGAGQRWVPLPLWPLLAALLLIWLLRHPPAPCFLWLAVCCGAFGAGAIALYESFVLGKTRASNGMNAIPFGNLSLLLGMLSLLAMLWFLRPGRIRPRWAASVALLAGLSGILGSLLSGTRGGWIALPFLLLLLYHASRGLYPTAWRRAVVVTALAAVTFAMLMPQTHVTQRLKAAGAEFQRNWHGHTGGSVGLRMEMWRGGVLLLLEKPVTGWGEEALMRAKAALIEQGRLDGGVARFHQLHSDLIDTLARRGILGGITLMLLYGVPLWLFWKRLRQPGAVREAQLLAAAGIMVCVAYMGFGLSQSMLRDARALSGYLGLGVACWVALRASESRRLADTNSAP